MKGPAAKAPRRVARHLVRDAASQRFAQQLEVLGLSHALHRGFSGPRER
jgi:hypothetical protein